MLRKTVINVLSIQTFISCQNVAEGKQEGDKITFLNSEAETRRDDKDAVDKNNNRSSHEFI